MQADEENWRHRLANRNQLVAEAAGEVVGTAGGIASEDGNAALISMWVAPSSRGRGVGEMLVRAVVDWARDGSYAAVRLWVADGNAAAESLYRRCGFVRTGATQPVFPEEPRMEFEMELVL